MARSILSASHRAYLAATLSQWGVPFSWLSFAFALTATVCLWLGLRANLEESAKEKFAIQAEFIASRVSHSLSDYQGALRAAAAFAAANPPTQDTWQGYYRNLRLEESLPGLLALAYARAEQGKFTITAVAPFNNLNRALLGNTLPTTVAATASMPPATVGNELNLRILPPVGIEGGTETTHNTLRLAMPVHPLHSEESHSTPTGYVLATLRFDTLIASSTNGLLRDVELSVWDTTTAMPILLFESTRAGQDAVPQGPAMLSKTMPLKFGDGVMALSYSASDHFGLLHEVTKTNVMLVGGVVLSVFLLSSLLALAHSYKNAGLTTPLMSADLHQNESRLYGIIQSAMEAIITVDEQQNIVMFNPMAERTFRCSTADAIGTPLSRFIPERFRDNHGNYIARFGQTGISERQMGRGRALWGLREDGEEFPVEASISQIRDEQGKLYTVLLRDITERQQIEQALQSSHNELAQLSARIQSIREEEKTHIARELHDDLGQRLTALKMDLSMLELLLPPEATAARERTKTMHRLIDTTVSAVRRIAADMRPVMLDDLGLAPAIEWLANDFSIRYRIKTGVHIEHEPVELSNETATVLFRIVQEALTNVARHAQASSVDITVTCDVGAWYVRISDNGQGADPKQIAKPKSFGLIGIRERTRLLGGKMHVFSKPGEGFCLEAIIPRHVEATSEAAS